MIQYLYLGRVGYDEGLRLQSEIAAGRPHLMFGLEMQAPSFPGAETAVPSQAPVPGNLYR
jgi:hypothetical protein